MKILSVVHALNWFCCEAAVRPGTKDAGYFEWALRGPADLRRVELNRTQPPGSGACGRAAFTLSDPCISAR
jgi:hypothetical protein